MQRNLKNLRFRFQFQKNYGFVTLEFYWVWRNSQQYWWIYQDRDARDDGDTSEQTSTGPARAAYLSGADSWKILISRSSSVLARRRPYGGGGGGILLFLSYHFLEAYFTRIRIYTEYDARPTANEALNSIICSFILLHLRHMQQDP